MPAGWRERRGLIAAVVTAFMLVVTGIVVVSAKGAGDSAEAGEPTSIGPALAVNGPAKPREEVEKTRHPYEVSTGVADPTQNWSDLYLPASDDEKPLPVVVLVHGGSWKAGIGAGAIAPFARKLAAQGYAVLNVEYRRVGSGGGWPATFSDVADAIDHLADMAAEEPRLDVSRVVVAGHSSGGQLAAWAGTRSAGRVTGVGGIPRVEAKAVISLAGVLDLELASWLGNDRIAAAIGAPMWTAPNRWAAIDPIKHVNKAVPVTAIVGTDDPLVPPEYSQRYLAALQAAGGTGRLVVLDGYTHTAVVDSHRRGFDEVLAAVRAAVGR